MANPEIPPQPKPSPRHFHRVIYLCPCGFTIHTRHLIDGSMSRCPERYHVSVWRIVCPDRTNVGQIFQRDKETYLQMVNRLNPAERYGIEGLKVPPELAEQYGLKRI